MGMSVFDRCYIPGTVNPNPDPDPDPSTITTQFGINWAPYNNPDGTMSSRSSVFQELEDYNFRNLRVRYGWTQQELADDVYDWDRMDLDFTDLAASNLASGKSMKLIILLELTDSSPTAHGTEDHTVPTYMLNNATYDDGEWEFQLGNSPTNYGYRIRAWNANVKARMIRYATALIDHIKETPAHYDILEGIGYTESAVGGATTITVNQNGYFAAVRDCMSNLRAQMPTKMVYQGFNSPRNQLWTGVGHLETIQGTLWGPDIFPDKEDYWYQDTNVPAVQKGIYRYYDERTNLVRFLDCQAQNYAWTADPAQRKAKPLVGHHPTIQEIYDFAIARGCNYLTFARDAATNPEETLKNWQRALNFMDIDGSPQKTIITGGMNTTVPPYYTP